MNEIEVKKVETVHVSSPEMFEVKVPYEVGDQYGNKATLYRKEVVRKEELEKQKESLLKQVEDIDEKLEKIEELPN